MTNFEHLAVLVSIVIGLGIAQLLTSVHAIAQARGRVRGYWLPFFWAALLFVTQVEWWWSFFELRQQVASWNFFYFLFVLLSPTSLYLAAAFVLPGIEPDQHYDLRAYYYESRGWFFGLISLNPALDAIRHAGETGSWLTPPSWTNAVAAVLIVSLAFSRRPWHHALITLAVTGLFAVFLVDSALQLR